MTKRYMRAVAAIAVPVCLASAPLAAADKQDLQTILQEVQALKKTYEDRIATLENKLKSLEKKKASAPNQQHRQAVPVLLKAIPLTHR